MAHERYHVGFRGETLESFATDWGKEVQTAFPVEVRE